nr:MAG TPA: hypothetical protein [Caudoviricetes sp.]
MPGNAHCFHLLTPLVENYTKILGKNQAILGFCPVFSKIKSLYYY